MYNKSIGDILGDIFMKGSLKVREFDVYLKLLSVLSSPGSLDYVSKELAKGLCLCTKKFLDDEDGFCEYLDLMFAIVDSQKDVAYTKTGEEDPNADIFSQAILNNISNPIVCKQGFMGMANLPSINGKIIYYNYNKYLL